MLGHTNRLAASMHSQNPSPAIDSVAVPGKPGRIGLSPCPGQLGRLGLFGPQAGALEADLDSFRQWGASTVVTLVEQLELEMLKLTELPGQVRGRELSWHHFPIPDGCAPGEPFERRWPRERDAIFAALAAGEHVVMHCLAGLGRTGTVAGRILIEHGVSAPEAVRLIRAARPGSIQTREQLDYLLELDGIAD